MTGFVEVRYDDEQNAWSTQGRLARSSAFRFPLAVGRRGYIRCRATRRPGIVQGIMAN